MVQKRDPEATRHAILDAAEAAFLEQGFADVSTSDIARRAGVTKSLIHHHFGSKQKLWSEVKVRRFKDYAEGQLAMLEGSKPNDELLKLSLGLYFHFLQANPGFSRLMAWMFLEADEECGQMEMGVLRRGVETIRAAQEGGFLRADVDPRHLLFVFVSIVEHWFQARGHFCRDLEMAAPAEELDAAYFNDMVKMFFGGVLPR